MWHAVLAELGAAGVSLTVAVPGRRRARKEVDVWLADGHQGALGVDVPTVIQLHEAPWEDPAQRHLLDTAFVDYYAPRSAEAVAQADQIVTPSAASKRQIVASYGVDEAIVHVAPHGVDTDVFHPDGAVRGRDFVRHRGGPTPYIIFVSAIHPRKNIPALRAAMAGLAGRGHPHGLVMVVASPADRSDAAALEREATDDLPGFPGRILVLRHLFEADLAAVIAGADVLCAPSFSEGFGFAPLEAMACATPVVVSDRGALPEVVGASGLITTTCAAAVEEALHRLITDRGLHRRLSEAGRQRSLEFTWRRTAATWLAALDAARRHR
jgi:glycosyltransferase involved in cell wall biosynthesis